MLKIRTCVRQNRGLETEPFLAGGNVVSSFRDGILVRPKLNTILNVFIRSIINSPVPLYRHRAFVGPIFVRLDETCKKTAAELGFDILVLEIMPGHIHLFASCLLKCSLTKCCIKGRSSRLLMLEFAQRKQCE